MIIQLPLIGNQWPSPIRKFGENTKHGTLAEMNAAFKEAGIAADIHIKMYGNSASFSHIELIFEDDNAYTQFWLQWS